jgi:hypothetical protein
MLQCLPVKLTLLVAKEAQYANRERTAFDAKFVGVQGRILTPGFSAHAVREYLVVIVDGTATDAAVHTLTLRIVSLDCKAEFWSSTVNFVFKDVVGVSVQIVQVNAPLPAGRYRIQALVGDEVLAAQEYRIVAADG